MEKGKLIETLKKSRPNAKDTTINMYASNLMKLMKLMEADSFKFLSKPDKIEDILKELHYTTRRNYLNAIVVYLMAEEDKNEDLIDKYTELRDELNKKYEEEQATGVISDKQKDNFVDISEINKMIEQMGKEIKDKNLYRKENLSPKERGLLQVYVIFNIYSRVPLRNDVAGMEAITKTTYNKLTEEDKKEKNYLVSTKSSMFMVLNRFKTQKKYGELVFYLQKDLEKILRQYLKINGMGVLFKSGTGKPLTRNALSQLLIKTSKKYMDKSISTTMLRKIYLSSKYADVKEEMNKDAKIMGHSTEVAQSVYVKKPQDS